MIHLLNCKIVRDRVLKIAYDIRKINFCTFSVTIVSRSCDKPTIILRSVPLPSRLVVLCVIFTVAWVLFARPVCGAFRSICLSVANALSMGHYAALVWSSAADVMVPKSYSQGDLITVRFTLTVPSHTNSTDENSMKIGTVPHLRSFNSCCPSLLISSTFSLGFPHSLGPE